MKANADKVTLPTPASAPRRTCAACCSRAPPGVKLQEVPYQGTGPALTDLVGGQVDFMCDQTTNTSGQITAGEVKAYAVTTPERVKSLPDLPTTTEAGLPELQVSVWHGLYVPKDTPQEVVQKLSEALKVALADQAVIDQMAKLGTAPVPADGRDAGGAPGAPRRAARAPGRRSSPTPGSRPPEVERRRSLPDILAGGIFVLIGGAFVVGSLGYELGTPLRMGPGYFPLLVGAILAALGWRSSSRDSSPAR